MRLVFLLSVLAIVFSTSLVFAADQMNCSGQSSEAGVIKDIAQKTTFEIIDATTKMAESSFNFKMSNETRLNIQLRAISDKNVLTYAATFSEIALKPLGRIENSFFEKIYPDTDGVIRLVKSFTDLKFKIVCKPN